MEKTAYISEVIILTGDAMVRSYGRKHIERKLKASSKALCPLICGCLFVMAAQAESNHATEKSPTVIERTGAAIEHGAKAAAHGVERGAKAAAHGIEVGVQATGRALNKVSQKIGITKASDS